MSDYLPPIVMELQGRDANMLAALRSAAEGVSKFAASLERLAEVAGQAAAMNERLSRSMASLGGAGERAAASTNSLGASTRTAAREATNLTGQTRAAATAVRGLSAEAKAAGAEQARFAQRAQLAQERVDTLAARAAIAEKEAQRLAAAAAEGGEGAKKLEREAARAAATAARLADRARLAGEEVAFLGGRAAAAGEQQSRLTAEATATAAAAEREAAAARAAAAETTALGASAGRSATVMAALGAESRHTAESMGLFSSRTARMGAAMGISGGEASGFVGKLKSVGLMAGAVGVAVAAVSVKMAGDFQASMVRLRTSAGETGDLVNGKLTGNLALVSSGVQKMAVSTATPLSELSAALYRIESAGFHGGAGLKILQAAAEGARAEGADLDTVANTLDSTMNAFGFKTSQVNGVMNAMVETVAHGKASMQELAGSLSTVTPVASAAGLKLQQMLGAMATMTAQGVTAKQASQNLAFAIRNLQAPSNVARQAMAGIGLDATDLSKNLGKRGLTGTFDLITQAVAKSSKGGMVLIQTMNTSKAAAQSAQTELAQMSGETKRLAQGYLDGKISLGAYKNAVKTLPSDQANLAMQFKSTADQANGFNQMLKNGSGPQKTAAEMLKRLMGGANGLNTYLELSGIHAGTFADNVAAIGSAAGKNSAHVEGFAQVQKTFNFQMEQAKQVFETTAVAIGSKLMPVVQSIMGFFQRHTTTAKVLAVAIGGIAIALGVAAAAMIAFEVATSPITAVVALIMLVVAGFVELYKHSELVRIGVANFFDYMKAGAGSMAAVFLTIVKGLVDTWLFQMGLLVKGAAMAFGWVPGLGGKLKAAARSFDDFSHGVDAKLQGMIDKANSWAQAQMNAAKERELKIRIDGWNDNLNAAVQKLKTVPASQRTDLLVSIDELKAKIAAAKAEIASLHDKTVTITFNGVSQGTLKGHSYTSTTGYSYANGGIHLPGVRAAADGLMTRQAGFASRPILWAEAGPEAYIPLSPGKRARSRGVAEQAVAALGGSVSWGGPFSMLGAAVPAGIAQGVAGGSGAARKATAGLAKAMVRDFSAELGIQSPSKVFRQLGIYVNLGLVQGLTGSTAQVKTAVKDVQTKLMEAYNHTQDLLNPKKAKKDKGLIEWVHEHEKTIQRLEKYAKREGAVIEKLAAKRDKVATRLKSAQANLASLQKQWSEEQKQVSDNIMQSVSVVMDASNNGGWLSSSQVVQNFEEQTQKALQFAGFLRQAKANGLNAAMVAQIAAAGVDSGYATAQALASANKGQIARLNSLQKSAQSAANGVGATTADAMYKAGIQSAQGLVKGLQSQEKAIDKQMLKIAKAMQKAIKHALGIKSPSRVFADLGQFIPQGLALGIREHTPHATAAVLSMSSAVAQAGPGGYALGAGAASGGNTYITVHVAGSVVTERQMADIVETHMLRKGQRRSVTYQPYSR